MTLPIALRPYARELQRWATEDDIIHIMSLSGRMSVEDAIKLTQAGITSKDPIPSKQALDLLNWARRN